MIEIKPHLILFVSLIILIIIIVCLKLYYKNLAAKFDDKEGFTATTGESNESNPWPLAGNSGLQPLIIKNLSSEVLPVLQLGVLYPGSISYIVGQYLQRKIYPVKLSIMPSTTTIMAKLDSGNVDTTGTSLDLGFIREPQLIGLARVESGIKSVSVLAPAYWETLYLIGNKYTTFAGLSELKRPATSQQPATQKIGVLRDSLPYWEAITRALELEIGRDFLKSENDNLAQLLTQLENREIDAVFMIVHTFDSRLQAFLKTNEVRMISIYPRSKYPQDTDMITRPYNPETTDLISKFRVDMKVYIPWIFEETVSLGTAVGNKKQLTISNLGSGTTGSSIYKTFKVRSYLCTNRQLGRDQKIITMLGKKYLEEYQTLGLLIQEWGMGSQRQQRGDKMAKQLVLPTLVFSDYDSFNPDSLGSIPNEIDLNPIMRDLIAKVYGRIKIENTGISCDI